LIRSSWPSSFAAGRDRRSTWGPQRLPLSLCCQFMRDLCCQVAKQPGSHAAANSVVAPRTHLRRCYEVVPRKGCTPVSAWSCDSGASCWQCPPHFNHCGFHLPDAAWTVGSFGLVFFIFFLVPAVGLHDMRESLALGSSVPA